MLLHCVHGGLQYSLRARAVESATASSANPSSDTGRQVRWPPSKARLCARVDEQCEQCDGLRRKRFPSSGGRTHCHVLLNVFDSTASQPPDKHRRQLNGPLAAPPSRLAQCQDDAESPNSSAVASQCTDRFIVLSRRPRCQVMQPSIHSPVESWRGGAHPLRLGEPYQIAGTIFFQLFPPLAAVLRDRLRL